MIANQTAKARSTTPGLFIMALVVAVAGGTHVSAQEASAASPMGWYRTPNGASVLVSPGPGGGWRRLDFENASFDAMKIGPGKDAFRWIPDGKGGPVLIDPDGGRWVRHPDPPYHLEEVAFRSVDGVRLAGLLLRPSRPRGRGAVLIHGSGASDRDNVWAYTFANALASAGVDVLFPDKRGSGASEGDWRQVGFDALAHDAVAGFDLLLEQTGLDPADAGWVGLSQGGWIAPLAARFAGRGSFTVSLSSAAVPVLDQIEFEIRNSLRQHDFQEPAIAQAMELQKAARGYALGQTEWREYSATRMKVLDGPAAPFAESVPSDSADWQWRWWARVGDYDPVQAWASSGVPALIMYGAEDERDNVPVKRSVERVKALERRPGMGGRITLVVMPAMGHTLVDPDRGWISAEVLSRLTGFVVNGSSP